MSNFNKGILIIIFYSTLMIFIGMAIGEQVALDSSEVELTDLSIERTELEIKILNLELLEQ